MTFTQEIKLNETYKEILSFTLIESRVHAMMNMDQPSLVSTGAMHSKHF